MEIKSNETLDHKKAILTKVINVFKDMMSVLRFSNVREEISETFLNCFMQVEGFEEWFEKEYPYVPCTEVFSDRVRYLDMENRKSLICDMYESLSDDQKIFFFNQATKGKK